MLCQPQNSFTSPWKTAPAVEVKEEHPTDRAVASLAVEKENSGLLNHPFTVRTVTATASLSTTARGGQTTVWFAWVPAGSGQNSITDLSPGVGPGTKFLAMIRCSLSPYQEAIRLSALIELQRGVHNAAVAMRAPNRQKAGIDATDAYQEAVAMLSHAQVPMSDSMVRDEIIYLRQLLHQIAQQFDRAA